LIHKLQIPYMAISKTQSAKNPDGETVPKEMATPPARYEDVNFVDSKKPVWNYSLFTDEDIRNFQDGTLYSAYVKFGSHQLEVLDKTGYYFSVWAPNATEVSVIGDFNNWKKGKHPLFVRLDKSGIWEGFIPDIKKGEKYKYYRT